MPGWTHQYKIRRSTNILSFAVRQNYEALNLFGEACYLIKIKQRANAVFQMDDRRIPTITKTASAFSIDPDTGYLRYKLWGRNSTPTTEYPDIGVFTCTVSTSGTTEVWEQAVDKYTFINGRNEYAFDIYQDFVDTNRNPIEDAVYIVFNTPPFALGNVAVFTFGTANPLIKFEGMQPIRDNEPGFYLNNFAYEQWLKPTARIRRKVRPNRFLVAFPDKQYDFKLNESGIIQESRSQYWTTPEPYSPILQEFDVIVRESTSQRFQLVSVTPIYIENIKCSQNLEFGLIDERSALYSIPIITT